MTRRQERIRRIARELAVLALMIVGIFAARSSLADHYVVPSGSMEHTLYPGDRVFVNKQAYGLRVPFTDIEILAGKDVARGDVVIFDSPADGTRLIKRVVAVGGDRVELENGRLVVNGRPASILSEPDVEYFGDRIVALRLDNGGGPNIATVVPAGKLLALGDHRGNSRDSRYFGLVSETEVYARAVAVYYRRGEGVVWRGL